jgi:hypothetical protein
MARVALVAPRPSGDPWIVAGAALGGLSFGAVLLTMNPVTGTSSRARSRPGCSSRGGPVRGARRRAGAPARRRRPRRAPSREGLSALLSLEREELFFLFRVLWGIMGPIALYWFIWKTADMKSNQAATGLLYVALVFVLIGELLSSYLTVATGFPA